jgi:uncharacterized membrane protein
MAISEVSKQEIPAYAAVQGKDVSENVRNLIKQQINTFNENTFISLDELNHFRRLYLTQLLEEENGELASIDQDVMNAIQKNEILSENIEPEIEANLSLGQRLADKIAEFGGSWTFISIFFVFLLVWMAINMLFLSNKGFDPYPFILLNLILSCLAAIQAPIIMMSQNRQEQKDRLRAEHDYKVNLKAELEIRLLNEKIDHLLVHQNKKLLEIQTMQIDYLEEVLSQIKKN